MDRQNFALILSFHVSYSIQRQAAATHDDASHKHTSASDAAAAGGGRRRRNGDNNTYRTVRWTITNVHEYSNDQRRVARNVEARKQHEGQEGEGGEGWGEKRRRRCRLTRRDAYLLMCSFEGSRWRSGSCCSCCRTWQHFRLRIVGVITSVSVVRHLSSSSSSSWFLFKSCLLCVDRRERWYATNEETQRVRERVCVAVCVSVEWVERVNVVLVPKREGKSAAAAAGYVCFACCKSSFHIPFPFPSPRKEEEEGRIDGFFRRRENREREKGLAFAACRRSLAPLLLIYPTLDSTSLSRSLHTSIHSLQQPSLPSLFSLLPSLLFSLSVNRWSLAPFAPVGAASSPTSGGGEMSQTHGTQSFTSPFLLVSSWWKSLKWLLIFMYACCFFAVIYLGSVNSIVACFWTVTCCMCLYHCCWCFVCVCIFYVKVRRCFDPKSRREKQSVSENVFCFDFLFFFSCAAHQFMFCPCCCWGKKKVNKLV